MRRRDHGAVLGQRAVGTFLASSGDLAHFAVENRPATHASLSCRQSLASWRLDDGMTGFHLVASEIFWRVEWRGNGHPASQHRRKASGYVTFFQLLHRLAPDLLT